ncbi:MAG: hypothetical protein N3B21_08755 [Clostridia bacterium]|nr:hypothetical protein [Clostridia bacterium]
MSSKHNNNIPGQNYWASQTPKSYSSKPPKTRMRVTFPPGGEFKLLNIAEFSAPGGMTMVLNLPFPVGSGGLGSICDSIRNAGGTVDIDEV